MPSTRAITLEAFQAHIENDESCYLLTVVQMLRQMQLYGSNATRDRRRARRARTRGQLQTDAASAAKWAQLANRFDLLAAAGRAEVRMLQCLVARLAAAKLWPGDPVIGNLGGLRRRLHEVGEQTLAVHGDYQLFHVRISCAPSGRLQARVLDLDEDPEE